MSVDYRSREHDTETWRHRRVYSVGRYHDGVGIWKAFEDTVWLETPDGMKRVRTTDGSFSKLWKANDE